MLPPWWGTGRYLSLLTASPAGSEPLQSSMAQPSHRLSPWKWESILLLYPSRVNAFGPGRAVWIVPDGILVLTMGVAKTRTTLYHPQADWVVKQYSRTLGYSLLALFQNGNQAAWTRSCYILCIPERHWVYATPHTPLPRNQKPANYLILGGELWLSDQVNRHTPPLDECTTALYVVEGTDG